MTSIERAAERVRNAVRAATTGLVERRVLTELVALTAVAQEHVLILGPPGTAKSQAVRRIAEQLRGTYFEYLLGRFTEPTDIFGPIDLVQLREGQVAVQTAGMLPEAEVVFLDEVFLGSTAILNTLLSLLNERLFVRGHTRVRCPLRVCIGASNSLPEDPGLAAFADRFLVRLFVEPLPDELLESLLEAGWGGAPRSDETEQVPCSTVADIDLLAGAAARLNLAGVRPLLAAALRDLRHAGVQLGDRRIVKTQRLVAAAAVLRGSTEATAADLWPLVFCAPTADEQVLARDVLQRHLEQASNATLVAASELASASVAARAMRLQEEIAALLAEHGKQPPRRRAEALLREISANFTEATLPNELARAAEELATATEALPGSGHAPAGQEGSATVRPSESAVTDAQTDVG